MREFIPPSYAARCGLPPAAISSLSTGWRGTEETIAAMGRLAAEAGLDPEVRYVAERVVGNDLPGRAYERECARLLHFVRTICRYTLDPRGVEQVKKPAYLLFEDQLRLSDCDDQSALLAALVLSIGHEAGFRAVKADPRRPSDYSHVYCVVRPRGIWLPADPIEPRCAFGEPPERLHHTWGGTTWTIHPTTGAIKRDSGPIAGINAPPYAATAGGGLPGAAPRVVATGRQQAAMVAQPYIL